MKKLFVGSLPWAIKDQELQDLFSQFGNVLSAHVLMDKMTGRSRGFGFVEMTNDAEGDRAIAALNGTDLGGRTLTINEARPKADRGSGGGGYRGNSGGGGRQNNRW